MVFQRLYSIFQDDKSVELSTQRCILRTPILKDSQAVRDFYLKNKTFLASWEPERHRCFYTQAYWKSWLRGALRQHHQNKACRFLICEKRSQNIIGLINFVSFERGAFQNCRLGYKLGEGYQGQGYMFEALSSAIPYIFERYALHRIEANYMPHNTRSGRLLKRLNFVEHGIAPKYLCINGQWEDHVLASLVKDEMP